MTKKLSRLRKSIVSAAIALGRRGESESVALLYESLAADDMSSGDKALQSVIDSVPAPQRALATLKQHLDDTEKLYKTLGQIIKAERSFLEKKAHEMSSGVADKTFFDFSDSGWAFGGAQMFAQHLSGVLSGLDQPKLAEQCLKAFGPVRPHPTVASKTEISAASLGALKKEYIKLLDATISAVKSIKNHKKVLGFDFVAEFTTAKEEVSSWKDDREAYSDMVYGSEDLVENLSSIQSSLKDAAPETADKIWKSSGFPKILKSAENLQYKLDGDW